MVVKQEVTRLGTTMPMVLLRELCRARAWALGRYPAHLGGEVLNTCAGGGGHHQVVRQCAGGGGGEDPGAPGEILQRGAVVFCCHGGHPASPGVCKRLM